MVISVGSSAASPRKKNRLKSSLNPTRLRGRAEPRRPPDEGPSARLSEPGSLTRCYFGCVGPDPAVPRPAPAPTPAAPPAAAPVSAPDGDVPTLDDPGGVCA